MTDSPHSANLIATTVRSRLLARVKPVTRRVVDRVMQPYIEEIVERMAGHDRESSPDAEPPETVGSTPLPPQFTVQHAALHEARTLALADVPPGAQTMLSAGASGKWYFDWVDESYGPIPRHIGIEAYLPRPDDLPANVEWIAADIAGDAGIATVDSRSVDLVFSGQNIEHLWPRQMVGLLSEANRVLRQDGLLVIDSPNRAITAAYRWSMGEHTIELTPAEASDLLALAGFSVERMKGVWLCRHDGQLLPLDPDPMATGPSGLVRRFALAGQRPDDSFIWWVEARRVTDPDLLGMSRMVDDLFTANWTERVSRLKIFEGEAHPWGDGRPGVKALKGGPSYPVMGPWMPVPAGAFSMDMEVAWIACDDMEQPFAYLEVIANDEMVASVELTPDGRREGVMEASCPFELGTLQFAIHVRLRCTGTAEVTVPLSLTITPDPWRVYSD